MHPRTCAKFFIIIIILFIKNVFKEVCGEMESIFPHLLDFHIFFISAYGKAMESIRIDFNLMVNYLWIQW